MKTIDDVAGGAPASFRAPINRVDRLPSPELQPRLEELAADLPRVFAEEGERRRVEMLVELRQIADRMIREGLPV